MIWHTLKCIYEIQIILIQSPIISLSSERNVSVRQNLHEQAS